MSVYQGLEKFQVRGLTVCIIECEQGSEQWHAARAGVITASMFSTIRALVGGLDSRQQLYVDAILAGKSEADALAIAGYKAAPKAQAVQKALNGEKVGSYSEAALNYAFRLACERITGKPLDEGFSTYQMKRGNRLEPDARARHEQKLGQLIHEAGFVVTTDGKFGASADGLIGDTGGSEYKCLVAPERIRSIVLDGDISEFMDQVQGCLWLTGRKWWHFCLYCPDLAVAGKDLFAFKVARDDDYIDALEQDLLAFDAVVENYRAQLENAPTEHNGLQFDVEIPETQPQAEPQSAVGIFGA